MNHWVWGAVAASACCFVTSEAAAYRVLENNGFATKGWSSSTIDFEVIGDPPPPITVSDAVADLTSAAGIWNDRRACRLPTIRVFRNPEIHPAGEDGRNSIQWIYANWEATGAAADAAGLTSVYLEKDDDGSPRIVEADIYLNAERFTWGRAFQGSGTPVSTVAVAAHEFGHALGLEHPCEFGGANSAHDCSSGGFSSSLMFPLNASTLPSLTADDIEGICGVYPEPPPSASSVVPEEVPVGEGAPCKKQSDCVQPLTCQEERCHYQEAYLGEACTANEECLVGECANGACRVSCQSDVECEVAGLSCDLKRGLCGPGDGLLGEECSTANDCVTGLCLVEPGHGGYCTRSCEDASPCSLGMTCELQGATAVCRRPIVSCESCAIRNGQSRFAVTHFITALFALALVMRQRQTRIRRLGKS